MSAMRLSDDGAARHLVPGLALPDLGFTTTSGGLIQPARVRGRTVLFVYPWSGRPGMANPPRWDDIPGAHGSTPEMEGFRDSHAAFVAAGVTVLGLSGQSSDWQLEAVTRLGLPFDLASDEAFALQRALSLPTFETGGITYYKRLTLLLDSGSIALAVYPVLDPGSHASEILSFMVAGG